MIITYEENETIGRRPNAERLRLHATHNWRLEVDIKNAEHVQRVQHHSQHHQHRFSPLHLSLCFTRTQTPASSPQNPKNPKNQTGHDPSSVLAINHITHCAPVKRLSKFRINAQTCRSRSAEPANKFPEDSRTHPSLTSLQHPIP